MLQPMFCSYCKFNKDHTHTHTLMCANSVILYRFSPETYRRKKCPQLYIYMASALYARHVHQWRKWLFWYSLHKWHCLSFITSFLTIQKCKVFIFSMFTSSNHGDNVVTVTSCGAVWQLIHGHVFKASTTDLMYKVWSHFRSPIVYFFVRSELIETFI